MLEEKEKSCTISDSRRATFSNNVYTTFYHHSKCLMITRVKRECQRSGKSRGFS